MLGLSSQPTRSSLTHSTRFSVAVAHVQEIKANSPAAMRSCKQLINNVYHSLGSPKNGEGLEDVKARCS
jgi:hypothetical protein